MQRKKHPIITLTTDFGEQDGYVGIMHGVILDICPQVTVINLSHAIPPQNIQAAAFILYQTFDYYPAHTVHCVVVDPGVGSKRRAIAVRTDQGLFVGPDNGVLSLVLSAVGVNVLEVVTLTNPAYQLATVSHTFHGRDIFAPAAAHLANGVPLSKLGPAAINLVQLNTIASTKDDTCQVLHIDHFGNLILNLTAKDIKSYETVTFWLGDYRVESLCTTFADVPEGDFLAYVGSTRQHIEIAIRNGNAAQALGARVGDTIRVFND